MDKTDTIKTATTNAAAAAIMADEYATKITALTGTIRYVEEEAAGKPFRIKGDGTIETIERLLGQPVFRRGDVTFYEALSFAKFVNRFKNATTVLFADPINAPKFTAVLDYHPQSTDQNFAAWDLFRAVLPLRHTPSWTTWAGANGQPMDQAAFAQFLEDNIPDIAEPAGARLVEIARTLEATVDVAFQSHIRTDNGAHRFNWVETVQGSATSQKDGRIEIPQEITLALQPFEGSKVYRVTARLRYRLAGGKVKLWFDLVRLQDVLTEAFNDELLKIDEALNPSVDHPAVPIYKGPAPAAQKPSE